MAEFINGKYVSPSGKVYYEAEEKRKAQKAARDALSGKSGIYVPASQTANAIRNAAVPITQTQKTDDKVYNIYKQAQQQRYQADLSAKLSAAQQAKNNATGIVQNRYSQSQQAADSQLKDSIAFADKQKQLMQQQRQLALADSQRASALAAENSLKDAYISYMLAGRNLPQQLKALGISGGLSETTAANLTNSYQNSRNAANLEKAAADRQAQLVYDTGLNEDALRYNQLVKDYTDDYNAAIAAAKNAYTQGLLAVEKDYASAANAAYSAPRASSKQTVSYSAPQTTGYRIGTDSAVYTTGAQLLQALKNLGFTQTQALDYARKNGIEIEE